MSYSQGFTGTQKGVTRPQLNTLIRILAEDVPNVAHHGWCIGADLTFHRICRRLGVPIFGHPPIKTDKMADLPREEFVAIAEPDDYLARDRDIVRWSSDLIATPKEMVEPRRTRSGTWYTVRQARLKKIRRRIIWPDGSLTIEGPNDIDES